jgi:hypothetical protein
LIKTLIFFFLVFECKKKKKIIIIKKQVKKKKIMSDYLDIYEAAKAGNFSLVEEIYKHNESDKFIVQMAIIGAAESKQTSIVFWALEHGACLLFALQQGSTAHSIVSHNYSKRLSMLKGPGEVLKGTFK